MNTSQKKYNKQIIDDLYLKSKENLYNRDNHMRTDRQIIKYHPIRKVIHFCKNITECKGKGCFIFLRAMQMKVHQRPHKARFLFYNYDD